MRWHTWFAIPFAIAGMYFGRLLGLALNAYLREKLQTEPPPLNTVLSAILVGLFAFLASDQFLRFLARLNQLLVEKARILQPSRVLSAVLGVIVGLIISFLFGFPLFFGAGNPESSYAVAGYLVSLAVITYLTTVLFFHLNPLANFHLDHPFHANGGQPKILDTNCFIDTRIQGVLKTGFVEGPFYVPSVVLRELHYLADSHDPARRERGRRGLDLLNALREDPKVQLRILEVDFPEEKDADSVIIKAARSLGGAVITTDYNLNKIASIYGVPVLNVNDLTNAVRPPVHHGDVLEIHLTRLGKEPGQAVGYLDDGTMVVVEHGEPYVGKTLEVQVTSILQTSSGRIVFARPDLRRAIRED